MSLSKRAVAEFIGTFWLVFGGCGAAVLDAAFPGLGIGFLGVAFAFGLALLTMAYAIGHISGCHVNPAVTVGLVVAKRFPVKDLPAYVIAQVLGGVSSAVLYVIASGQSSGFSLAGGFASNGYGAHSPGGYALSACITAEVVLTFMFLMIILGATDEQRSGGLRADRDWIRSHADSPDRNSRDESLGQSGAQHRAGGLRGRMGARPAMDVLARSNYRSCDCGRRVRVLPGIRADTDDARPSGLSLVRGGGGSSAPQRAHPPRQ